MNNLRNSVQLIGHLGQNPELKEMQNGKILLKVSIATNDFYTNQNGEKTSETTWHNIVAWGKLANTMNNILKKGSEVVVKGKLQHRNYEDKNGIKRYISEVLVNEFVSLTKKSIEA